MTFKMLAQGKKCTSTQEDLTSYHSTKVVGTAKELFSNALALLS